jgi:capsular polysaccharide biosynthesis protein
LKIIEIKKKSYALQFINYFSKIFFFLYVDKYLKRFIKINLGYLYNRWSYKLFFKRRICFNFFNLEEYSKTTQLQIIKIFDKATTNTDTPKVYPIEKISCLVRPHANYAFPVYMAEMSDAWVRSKTNVVSVGDKAILQDLYDPVKDYMFEELAGRYLLNTEKKLISFLDYDNSPINLDSAATFLDAVAHNYAHWVTEVLPRIAAFCTLKKFKNVPLLIDDGLHPNIMESLALIIEEDRQVYLLPKKLKIKVKKLYVVSVTGYIPVQPKNKNLDNQGMFSPYALKLIRNRIFAIIDNLPAKDSPKKIYLKRNSKHRILINEKEIIKILISKGYVIIEPEKLSFLQQVSIIKNAEYITGVSGAGFGNLIFASSDSEINILIGEARNTPYWYWQNIALAVNLKVNYFFGKINNVSDGVHSDFTINPKLIW